MFKEMLISRIASRVRAMRIAKHQTLRKYGRALRQEDIVGVNRLVVNAIENKRVLKGNKSYLPIGTLEGLSIGLAISTQEIVFGDEVAQKRLIKHIFNLVSLYSYTKNNSVLREQHDKILKNAQEALWHVFAYRAKFSYLFAEINYFPTQDIFDKMQDINCWPPLIKETFKETRESIWILVRHQLFESFQQEFIFNQKNPIFLQIEEDIIDWINSEFIEIIRHVENSREIVPIYMIGYQVSSLMKFASIQIEEQLMIDSPEMLGNLLREVEEKRGMIANLSISSIYFDTIKKLIGYQEKGLKGVDKAFKEVEARGIYSLYI